VVARIQNASDSFLRFLTIVPKLKPFTVDCIFGRITGFKVELGGGGMDWIHLAQDGEQWRVLVYKVTIKKYWDIFQ
jgi:H+/Cl- antiporter ClcA